MLRVRHPDLAPMSKTYTHLQLGNGGHAIVDEEDFAWLSEFRWHGVRHGNCTYARAIAYPFGSRGGQYSIFMHQLIMRVKGSDIDHVNGDGLDNRKCNLRLCSKRQNQQNRKKVRGVSRFKGVCPHYYRYKGHCLHRGWRATIKIDGRQVSLGVYPTEELAAQAYNEAAQKAFGEFASLNHLSAEAA